MCFSVVQMCLYYVSLLYRCVCNVFLCCTEMSFSNVSICGFCLIVVLCICIYMSVCMNMFSNHKT